MNQNPLADSESVLVWGRKVAYWFVVHTLESYKAHPDMIGCRVKNPGEEKPWYGPFGRIVKGDKIVYYCRGDKYILEYLM